MNALLAFFVASLICRASAEVSESDPKPAASQVLFYREEKHVGAFVWVSVCGGALLTDRATVVTSGRCCDQAMPTHVGQDCCGKTEIKEAQIHPFFNGRGFDVCVVSLAEPLKSEKILPARLSDEPPHELETAIAFGWTASGRCGVLDKRTYSIEETPVSLVPVGDCRRCGPRSEQPGSAVVCAKEEARRSPKSCGCNDGIEGPLFDGDVLVGIAAVRSCDEFIMFSRIHDYSQWIWNVAANARSSSKDEANATATTGGDLNVTVAGVQEKDSNHTQQEEQEEGPVATETSEGTTTESTDAIELNVTKVCNNTAPEEIVEVSEAAEEKNASTAYDAELLIRSMRESGGGRQAIGIVGFVLFALMVIVIVGGPIVLTVATRCRRR